MLLDVDWQRIRTEFAQTIEQPTDCANGLSVLATEQAELLKSRARERDVSAEAQLAEGHLVVDAVEPKGAYAR